MSKADKRENIILIASEPLTFEKGMYMMLTAFACLSDVTSLADWMEIPTNTMVVITPKMVTLEVSL